MAPERPEKQQVRKVKTMGNIAPYPISKEVDQGILFPRIRVSDPLTRERIKAP